MPAICRRATTTRCWPGRNRIAVQTDAGDWEVIGFAGAELVAPETYRLTRLLRGQGGTDFAIGDSGIGNNVVLLDGRVPLLPVAAAWLETTGNCAAMPVRRMRQER